MMFGGPGSNAESGPARAIAEAVMESWRGNLTRGLRTKDKIRQKSNETSPERNPSFLLDLPGNSGSLMSPHGVLAQLVERLNGIEEVSGSIPLGSITQASGVKCFTMIQGFWKNPL